MKSNKNWVKYSLILFVILKITGCTQSPVSSILPVSLQCEYKTDPIGIDTKKPALSWQLESADSQLRGLNQSGYHILVASDPELLASGKGDLWDSGIVDSDKSTHIIYEGKSLVSRDKCYWKVRVRDKAGNFSPWSSTGKWEMGLLNRGDWQGDWIGSNTVLSEKKPDNNHHQPALYLRKETDIKNEIKSAKAFISGLGYYEIYINGNKVGDHVLDPGFTDYSKSVLYVTYDVTDQFKEGKNAIGVILGGGWYDMPTPDAWGFHDAPWTAPPKLLLNIFIDYADGTQDILKSDKTWKNSSGPIVFNCVRGGEIYDAQKEIPGWNQPGYDDSGWNAVSTMPGPSGKLIAQQHPPIRKTKIITPVSLTEPVPGVYVYDLGVNIAGWARFKVRGEKGDTVSLFFNEHLNPDGTVRHGAHAWHTYGPYQTNKYICHGREEEITEPRFTYHGFQYVQVTGLKSKPALDDLKGIRVHTDPQQAGKFACSNPDINKIQELILRTQLNNLHGIPTDCPHREKIGWMGDGLVTMEEAIYNFNMATFYIKWFHDMLDAQENNGHVPPIVPNPGWKEATAAKNPDDVIPSFSDPWWGGALLLTPWHIYQYYGDSRYIAEGYDAMKAYMNWIGSKAKDYIFIANLGDWIEPAMFSGEKITPKDQIGTSAYFYFAHLMNKMAMILQKPHDAEKYALLAKNIREKYNKTFFNEETALYAEDSELAQVIPLLFNIVPEGQEKRVEEQLIQVINNKFNKHLNTGFIGTPMLFKLLTQLGHNDLAYTMATQEDHPGWIFMLRNGATSIWEVWDALTQINHSRNHPAFGSISAWYYQSVAGIQPDPEGPGFKKIIIKPEVMGDLKWGKASYESMFGQIECDWKREGEKFHLKITIPVNTTATVFIPANSKNSIMEGNMLADQANNVAFIEKNKEKYMYKIGSGTYHFTSDYQ